MHLKTCSGCARAIAESATSCSYCGQKQQVDAIVSAPGGAVRLEQLFECEVATDDSTPQPSLLDAVEKETERAVVARPSIEALDDFDAEEVAAPESTRAVSSELAKPAPTLADLSAQITRDSATMSAPAESVAGSDEAEADEAIEPEMTAEVSAPSAALPIAEPASVRPGMGRRKLVMGLLGVAGVLMVMLAMLATRGAASPEAAPVAQVQTQRSTPTPRSTAAVSPVAPKWTSNPAPWVGRERKSAAFEVAAINKVQVWMRQVQPMLVVRCRAGAAEVFVFTDSPAKMEPQDGDHTVRIRLDANPPVTARWPDSAEHDALFAPDGAAFLRRLAGAKTLEFGFSPHNSNPVVASFDVTGLSEHLATAPKQCGWESR